MSEPPDQSPSTSSVVEHLLRSSGHLPARNFESAVEYLKGTIIEFASSDSPLTIELIQDIRHEFQNRLASHTGGSGSPLVGISGARSDATSSQDSDESSHLEFGTVKWFNNEKGYGFISPDGGGKDIFLDHRRLRTPDGDPAPRNVQEGQRVKFSPQKGTSDPIKITANQAIISPNRIHISE